MALSEDFTINDGEYDYDISVMDIDESSRVSEAIQKPLESQEKFNVKIPSIRFSSSHRKGIGKMRNFSFE